MVLIAFFYLNDDKLLSRVIERQVEIKVICKHIVELRDSVQGSRDVVDFILWNPYTPVCAVDAFDRLFLIDRGKVMVSHLKEFHKTFTDEHVL